MTNTEVRYGHEVDQYSAEIIDRLDDAFAEHTQSWKIAKHSGLAINRNRHMIVKDTSEYTCPEGKLPSEVFTAVREADLAVTGVHTDVRDGPTARVWVEVPSENLADFALEAENIENPTEED